MLAHLGGGGPRPNLNRFARLLGKQAIPTSAEGQPTSLEGDRRGSGYRCEKDCRRPIVPFLVAGLRGAYHGVGFRGDPGGDRPTL